MQVTVDLSLLYSGDGAKYPPSKQSSLSCKNVYNVDIVILSYGINKTYNLEHSIAQKCCFLPHAPAACVQGVGGANPFVHWYTHLAQFRICNSIYWITKYGLLLTTMVYDSWVISKEYSLISCGCSFFSHFLYFCMLFLLETIAIGD